MLSGSSKIQFKAEANGEISGLGTKISAALTPERKKGLRQAVKHKIIKQRIQLPLIYTSIYPAPLFSDNLQRKMGIGLNWTRFVASWPFIVVDCFGRPCSNSHLPALPPIDSPHLLPVPSLAPWYTHWTISTRSLPDCLHPVCSSLLCISFYLLFFGS